MPLDCGSVVPRPRPLATGSARLIGALAVLGLVACATQETDPPGDASGGAPSGGAGAGLSGLGGETPIGGGSAGVSTAGSVSGGVGFGGSPSGASGGAGSLGGATSTGGAPEGGAGSSGDGGQAGRGGGGGTPGGGAAGAAGAGGAIVSGGASGASSAGAAGAAGASDGPRVDRSNPKLYELHFTAKEADSEAARVLGNEYAYLDTRVPSAGKLVVYLHGAGDFTNCGNGPLGTLVAGWGFHWFGPCYLSNYGVENCGSDIEGCRMEAFEGVDHHAFVQIPPPDSIERRIVRGLRRLASQNPQGDWMYFLDGEKPRWSKIVITGHSHGASSSAVIGMHREVARVVSLAGPYDPGQAWLSGTPLTPRDRFFGFSHTGDGQHQGHLAAFAALGLSGMPVRVDGAAPPYSGSHRLYSSASVSDPHGSVTSGNIADYVNVWRYLYGAP